MNKFKPKDEVYLSPASLYARPIFQKRGSSHLKLGEVGVIAKVLDGLEEGFYVVKFKDGNVEKTNSYVGGMLELIGEK
jgi:regulator of sirC expression with transglutaminase-like and TPR domain